MFWILLRLNFGYIFELILLLVLEFYSLFNFVRFLKGIAIWLQEHTEDKMA